MTPEFAKQLIKDRALELGYQEEDYTIDLHHDILKPRSTLDLNYFNALFMLVENTADVAVNSELGIYDLSSDRINKQQYEHQSQISITNQTNSIRHIRYLHIIFNTNKPCQ
jgi:hypothetical protein